MPTARNLRRRRSRPAISHSVLCHGLDRSHRGGRIRQWRRRPSVAAPAAGPRRRSPRRRGSPIAAVPVVELPPIPLVGRCARPRSRTRRPSTLRSTIDPERPGRRRPPRPRPDEARMLRPPEPEDRGLRPTDHPPHRHENRKAAGRKARGEAPDWKATAIRRSDAGQGAWRRPRAAAPASMRRRPGPPPPAAKSGDRRELASRKPSPGPARGSAAGCLPGMVAGRDGQPYITPPSAGGRRRQEVCRSSSFPAFA